jgi:hypothetical protein
MHQQPHQTNAALKVADKFRKSRLCAGCLAFSSLAFAQVSYGDREVRVQNLAPATARSEDAADVLAASLEMVFRDKEVCCGKDSALESTLQKADPQSLKDAATKLEGRHLLSDGRPIVVQTEYLTAEQVSAGHMILMLRQNRAPLMMCNSHLYVIEGMTYVESSDNQGNSTYVIHKFSMQDTRYSDTRRNLTFDRLKQDASKIQGILFVQAAPQ